MSLAFWCLIGGYRNSILSFFWFSYIYPYLFISWPRRKHQGNNGYLKGYKNLALQWTDDYHDYRNDSLSAGFVALAVFVFVRGVGGGIV